MSDGEIVLVLGLGNRLMSDDAAGPLVIDRLAELARTDVVLRDGGTMGMSLLPEIEDADAIIAVDAARFGGAPGTVRVFEGNDMDSQVGGLKKTAHEVALADLMSAAAIQNMLPRRRALVAVEPEKVSLGLEPTQAVSAAIPQICAAVDAILARWRG